MPLKTALRMGITVAFGCDVPASIYQEPKWAFTGAVMRRSKAGQLNQAVRLRFQEALRVHTMGPAYGGFAEEITRVHWNLENSPTWWFGITTCII